MATKLNQDALTEYLEQILYAFKNGKVSGDQQSDNLVWIVTEAGMGNTDELEARFADSRELLNIS